MMEDICCCTSLVCPLMPKLRHRRYFVLVITIAAELDYRRVHTFSTTHSIALKLSMHRPTKQCVVCVCYVLHICIWLINFITSNVPLAATSLDSLSMHKSTLVTCSMHAALCKGRFELTV